MEKLSRYSIPESIKLRPVIEKVYALEEAAETFATLKTGRSKGKLVIKVTKKQRYL
jgi:NADPH:quinone reductase-like Zn-dependent oxidoreductase